MSKTEQIRVRLEPEVKQQANVILDELGLSVSDAVSLFMRQIIHHRGLPFSLNIPNAETIAAIEELERGEGITMTYDEWKKSIEDL